MRLYYFDSGGLVKNYVQERGTDWVQSTIADPENLLLISKTAGPEVISALVRKRTQGELADVDYQEAVSRFERDLADHFVQLTVSDPLSREAIEIIKIEVLRAYDAVQLATALRFRSISGVFPFVFVSADGALCRAAERRGPEVVNPDRLSSG